MTTHLLVPLRAPAWLWPLNPASAAARWRPSAKSNTRALRMWALRARECRSGTANRDKKTQMSGLLAERCGSHRSCLQVHRNTVNRGTSLLTKTEVPFPIAAAPSECGSACGYTVARHARRQAREEDRASSVQGKNEGEPGHLLQQPSISWVALAEVNFLITVM